MSMRRSRDYRTRAYYASPASEVWRALTDREELAQWLLSADFRPVVGHRFRWHDAVDGTPCPLEGADCEVIEADPPHRLKVIARTPRSLRDEEAETFRMTWTLEVAGPGTWLTLEQEFLPEATIDRTVRAVVMALDPARKRRHPSWIRILHTNDERQAA